MNNTDGTFTLSDSRTPPGQSDIFEGGETANSDAPQGCYVNLGETSKISGQTVNRTGSLWFNSDGTSAGRQRPVVCQSPITGELYDEENTNFAYID